jgi:hypothetical protein
LAQVEDQGEQLGQLGLMHRVARQAIIQGHALLFYLLST